MSINVIYFEKEKITVDIDKQLIEKELKEFEKFFEYCFQNKLKSIQKNYAKRFFAKLSFSMVAPTGTGKTLIGLFLAFYNSFVKNKKSLLIFPTQLLIKQSKEIFFKYINKIEDYISRSIEQDEFLFFLSNESETINKEKKSKLSQNKYKLVFVTNQFLSRSFDLFNDKYDYIFVDDLDSISRGSKNTIKILKLLNFSEEEINYVKSNASKDISIRFTFDQLKDKGQLVISSATLKRGLNSLLFRRLLNFDVGNSLNYVRNINDIFVGKKDIGKLKEIIEFMGPGAIIFTESQEEAKQLEKIIPDSKFINSKNISKIDLLVDIYEDYEEKISEEDDTNEEEILEVENFSYLISVASPYSVLVRGLDLPYKIRYVVFWGIPKRKLNLNEIDKYQNNYLVQKFLSNLFFKKRMVSFDRIKNYIQTDSSDKVISTFVLKDRILYSIDAKTYLQASGRCSRITSNNITRGVSFVFDDEVFLEPFIKSAYFNSFEVTTFNGFELLQEEKNKIDFSRSKNSNNLSNNFVDHHSDVDLKTYLMVVESPTKAKQIAKMFGNPAVINIGNIQAFEVVSPIGLLYITPSLGHITELSVDDIKAENNIYNVIVYRNGKIKKVELIYCPIKRCKDCGKTFSSTSSTCIYCSSVNITNTWDNLRNLKTLSFFTDGVILASDPDSEGEKISFDIASLIESNSCRRVVFSEITKKAIINSLQNPSEIRENLVNAQLVRRIEDRWIGFALSKILKEKTDDYNISAGRVQSPVLHWIVERYKEYNQKRRFAIVEDFKLQFMDSQIKGKAQLKIEKVGEYVKKFSALPFNTSDIIIFANNILKLNSVQTMAILQKLFENGLITYHRTDSYYISSYGVSIAKEIFAKNGWNFHYKNPDQQHTHEAIRITKPLNVEDIKIAYQDKLNPTDYRLYDMIYKRFLASFAPEGQAKVVKYKFTLSQENESNSVEIERIVSLDGEIFQIFPYLAYKQNELEEGIYEVKVKNIKKPSVMLYTQADIVNKMREKGIGRPSTYAHIIQKLIQRGYIIEKFNRLIPTKKGIIVDQILTSNYNDFVNEYRTKELMSKIDDIENGKRESLDIIDELYNEVNRIVFQER